MQLDQKDLDQIARAVATHLARTREGDGHAALEPLSTILGISPEAARMRELRTDGIRKLAIVVGRRRMYRREDVAAFFANKNR